MKKIEITIISYADNDDDLEEPLSQLVNFIEDLDMHATKLDVTHLSEKVAVDSDIYGDFDFDD